MLEARSLDLVDTGVSFLLARLFTGFDCGPRNIEGTAESEMAQPRPWDWLSRIVECDICDASCLLAEGS